MKRVLRVPDYLSHIQTALERIDRHTAGVDQTQFTASELVQDAVIRNLEVIGEAANNILQADPAFAAAHTEVPWQIMYAMRNRLSHGYDQVDMGVVWMTVERDLPALRAWLQALIRRA